MKIKSAVKYYLTDAKKSLMVYYLIVYVILIVSTLAINRLVENGGNASVSGFEMSSVFFLFILGLNSFKENFKMFLQNSLSRETLFISFVISILMISAFMAFMDRMNEVIANSLLDVHASYQSLFSQLYSQRYLGNSSSIRIVLEGFLWYFSVYGAIAMAGYFITILYYRMNKAMKILVSIGVPALLIIVLPFIDINFANGVISRYMFELLLLALGYKHGFNPYYFMITSIISFVVFGLLSYSLARRAETK